MLIKLKPVKLSVKFFHKDLAELNPKHASRYDVMITDPAYSKRVHKKATSQSSVRGTRHRDLGFDYLDAATRRLIGRVAANVQRWSVMYSDVESCTWLRIACQAAGAEYVRTMPWVRWSMPQLSGDRPVQGWEVITICHRQHVGKRGGLKPMKKSWNGAGNTLDLVHKCLRGEGKHKAEKSLDQALDLVLWFSRPGEVVFDPFCGHGTFGLACLLLGRSYVGYDKNLKCVRTSRARCKADLSKRDLERVRRFLRKYRKEKGHLRIGSADKKRIAQLEEQYGENQSSKKNKTTLRAAA